MKRSHVLTFVPLIILSITLGLHHPDHADARLIGPFPGFDELTARADVIAVIQIDSMTPIPINIALPAEVTFLKTLKGEVPLETLEVGIYYMPNPEGVGPAEGSLFGTPHLVFLERQGSGRLVNIGRTGSLIRLNKNRDLSLVDERRPNESIAYLLGGEPPSPLPVGTIPEEPVDNEDGAGDQAGVDPELIETIERAANKLEEIHAVAGEYPTAEDWIVLDTIPALEEYQVPSKETSVLYMGDPKRYLLAVVAGGRISTAFHLDAGFAMFPSDRRPELRTADDLYAEYYNPEASHELPEVLAPGYWVGFQRSYIWSELSRIQMEAVQKENRRKAAMAAELTKYHPPIHQFRADKDKADPLLFALGINIHQAVTKPNSSRLPSFTGIWKTGPNSTSVSVGANNLNFWGRLPRMYLQMVKRESEEDAVFHERHYAFGTISVSPTTQEPSDLSEHGHILHYPGNLVITAAHGRYALMLQAPPEMKEQARDMVRELLRAL